MTLVWARSAFVSGHDFSRAATAVQEKRGFQPLLWPFRCADPKARRHRTTGGHSSLHRKPAWESGCCNPIGPLRCSSMFCGRTWLRSALWSLTSLLPDHFHALIEVGPKMTIEKAMQFIKGGFSYRMKKELGYPAEVWQRGFSEVSVAGEESLRKHREYIAQNPLRAGLVREGEEFAWCFETLNKRKTAAAKASSSRPLVGTSELMP